MRRNRLLIRFGYKDIDIPSFTPSSASLMMTAMSIRNVKVDLFSVLAIGAFALYVVTPFLA
jgi:hypothetical protein